MKTNIAIDISPTYLAKSWVFSYGPKCCRPIKLQDSLKCNIVMNYEVYFLHADEDFSKVILLFWVRVTVPAQSTQNKFAYLCNISIKGWEMKLHFCLQINTKVFYKMVVSLWV